MLDFSSWCSGAVPDAILLFLDYVTLQGQFGAPNIPIQAVCSAQRVCLPGFHNIYNSNNAYF